MDEQIAHKLGARLKKKKKDMNKVIIATCSHLTCVEGSNDDSGQYM